MFIYGKMLKHKTSRKVLMIFILEGPNDDLGFTLSFSMAMLNLRYGFLYAKRSSSFRNA